MFHFGFSAVWDAGAPDAEGRPQKERDRRNLQTDGLLGLNACTIVRLHLDLSFSLPGTCSEDQANLGLRNLSSVSWGLGLMACTTMPEPQLFFFF